MNLAASINTNLMLLRNLGLAQAMLYKYRRAFSRNVGDTPFYYLYSKHAQHPVRCRPNTSDIDVFKQIFGGREYRCLDDVHEAKLIIDCGANVGYSTVYFLTRYPNATVIAVEPDPENFALLQANIAPYGQRCRAICSGVWSSNAGLVISEAPFGDGREWARTVREVRPGEAPMMKAVDIGGLLEESGEPRISILKIDIEGSEAEVFASNHRQWLDRVDNLVIELHGARCKEIFMGAMKGSTFTMAECDELTVCTRPTTRQS
jgi:FkbM family methyltransferase